MLFKIFAFYFFNFWSNEANNILTPKHKTDIRTIPNVECNEFLLEYDKNRDAKPIRDGISERQYCAMRPNGTDDNCKSGIQSLQILTSNLNPADSSNAKVVGIISFGVGCFGELPNVYTKIPYYAEWIESIVWANGILTTN